MHLTRAIRKKLYETHQNDDRNRRSNSEISFRDVDFIDSLQEKPYAVPYKVRGNKCRFRLIFAPGLGAFLSRVYCGISPTQLELNF
jgi:hypothetical protein